jgi:hypothetical protein
MRARTRVIALASCSSFALTATLPSANSSDALTASASQPPAISQIISIGYANRIGVFYSAKLIIFAPAQQIWGHLWGTNQKQQKEKTK